MQCTTARLKEAANKQYKLKGEHQGRTMILFFLSLYCRGVIIPMGNFLWEISYGKLLAIGISYGKRISCGSLLWTTQTPMGTLP